MKAGLTLVAGVLVGLLLIEAGFRLVEPLPLTGLQIAACEGIEPDPDTGYRYRPGSEPYHERYFEYAGRFRINNLGFRDLDREPGPAETNRILVVGDSFTASLHVALADSWPQIAERRLNESRPTGARRVEIVNGGLSGTGIDTHLVLIERLAATLRPDTVALMFLWNDDEDAAYAPQYHDCYKGYRIIYQTRETREKIERLIDEKHDRPVLHAALKQSLVVRALNYHLRWLPVINVVHHGDITTPWVLNRNPHRLSEAMERFAALSVRFEFRPLVIPPLGKPDDGGRMISGYDLIRAAAARCGISTIDLRPAILNRLRTDSLAPQSMFFRLDGHYNEVGHRLFGEAVANATKSLLDEKISTGRRPPPACGAN